MYMSQAEDLTLKGEILLSNDKDGSGRGREKSQVGMELMLCD